MSKFFKKCVGFGLLVVVMSLFCGSSYVDILIYRGSDSLSNLVRVDLLARCFSALMVFCGLWILFFLDISKKIACVISLLVAFLFLNLNLLVVDNGKRMELSTQIGLVSVGSIKYSEGNELSIEKKRMIYYVVKNEVGDKLILWRGIPFLGVSELDIEKLIEN